LNIDFSNNIFLVNILGLVLGFIFGMVGQKTQFCFSGSIKDYVLTGSNRRAASVVIAMITAIISTQAFGYFYNLDFSKTVFLKADVNFVMIIIGGALFGAGMMIADGCSNRHLIKFAQGDKYSLITLVFIGAFAYMTANGVLNLPYTWLSEFTPFIYISSFIPNINTNILVALLPLFVILKYLAKYGERIPSLWDGMAIGLIIGIGWFVTGVIGFDEFEPHMLDSLRFVYPSGQMLEYLLYFTGTSINFSICVILGIIAGAFIMSQFNKKYSFGCTSDAKGDRLKNSIYGGALMGVGGYMALGCTVGQGLTGLSTLAFSSLVAISSIMISGYFTAKYLHKKDRLPMCFIFDWEDGKK
jgi:uncharacterized membrane protein YedE/YeeE